MGSVWSSVSTGNMSLTGIILSLCLVAVAAQLFRWLWSRRNVPPGPPCVPFLGCLPFVKPVLKVITSDEMAQKYGDVVRFEIGTAPVYILNDFKQTKDLFNKDVVSNRHIDYWYWHRFVKGEDGIPKGIVHTNGAEWSEQRRFALKTLRDFGFGKRGMDAIIQEEASDLVRALLDESSAAPNEAVRISQTFNVSVINVLWQIVADRRFRPKDAETQDMMETVNALFAKDNYKALSLFPELRKYMPYTEMDRKLFRVKRYMRQIVEEHEEDFDESATPRDFIDVYLSEMRRQRGRSSFSKDHLLNICIDFLNAGSETTSTTLTWAVLYMALHPEVQARCLKEIDAVLGRCNLAVFSDRESMLYVQATILEIQRMSATAPSSLPHQSTKEIHINGYTIPKGSKVICNLRRFMRDPAVFEEPDRFNPDRFLSEDGKSIRKFEHMTPFGIGKRICMGETLARAELFIFFVTMLQQVEIGLDGSRPEPSEEDTTMMVTHILNPFYVTVKSRGS